MNVSSRSNPDRVMRMDSAIEENNGGLSFWNVQRGRRPDIHRLMSEFQDEARMACQHRIGVVVCGPEMLISEVKRVGFKLSSPETYVDVHAETFEF